MDNDEDDDGNFTKWMSSYWGHSTGEEQAKDRRRSFRKPSLPRPHQDRRASLPCQSQLNAMRLNHLHSATTVPPPIHPKPREKTDVRPHPRARRASSDDNSHVKSPMHSSRITTIHELSESFERRLRFRSRNVMSLSDADDLCLICHDEARSSRRGGRETHCIHRPHKEGRKPQGRLSSSGSSGVSSTTTSGYDGQKSEDEPTGVVHENCHKPRRKFSFRWQR
ncbi:hypothetical protein JZ751_027782 [Albula glossodonta]|uniref:Leukemia NUP98 fusion partner 1 n=1 Tax=Albula glossodonta TaxID=121402 RepID=A0A8T2PAT6_9TELE|nr:hypothetical protein JZ751_027782 [Albula glossodonta]